MTKSRKKSGEKVRSKKPNAVLQVREMVEDLKDAGLILSEVARHFHNRVKTASRFLTQKKTKNAKHSRKASHSKGKKKRRR